MTNYRQPQPPNINYTSTNNFQFKCPRIKTASWHIVSMSLPGVSSTPTMQPTPFVLIDRPGEIPIFDDLSFTFLVDEDYSNWLELHAWMSALYFPDNFDQYKNYTQNNSETVEAQVIITTNNKNPKLVFNFRDIFPITLSGFQLTYAEDQPVVADVVFRYNQFAIEVLE